MGDKLAFLFPGQGSQSVGMLADFETDSLPLFQQASDILDYDLWKIVSEGPLEKLNQTIYTQPAMLTADIALWQVWRKKTGKMPTMMAGHSLGEYAALVAAEAIEFSDALRLVSSRAALMQEAVSSDQGAMLAVIGLSVEQIDEICNQLSQIGVVEAANLNSPKQTVLSGEKVAIEKALELSKEKGAKLAKLLSVSIPSHCSLMKPAAEALAKQLKKITIKSPVVPVIHNVDASPHTEPKEIADALVRQLYSPVHWSNTIQYMVTKGITKMVECGPGKVLSGLNRSIDKNIESIPFSDINLILQPDKRQL